MTTVVLWVSDLTKSVAFYKALFGAQHAYESAEFASAEGGGNEVLLHLVPEKYRGEASLGEDNPIKPVFTVASIEQAKLEAGQNGGRIKPEVMEHEPWRYADGTDPDGHIIQVREKY